MIKPLLVGLALLAAAPASAIAQDFPQVANTSFVAANGEKTMRLSIVVNVPADKVWWALSTAEGWKSWTVGTAYVDFREGGQIETNYKPGQPQGGPDNIRNQIIAVDDGRLLVFRNVQAPRTFKHPEEFSRIITSIRLEPTKTPGGLEATSVTISGAGYAPNPAYDELYGFFSKGNAFSLVELKDSLEKGSAPAESPTDRLGVTP